MNHFAKTALAGAVALAFSQAALAGTAPYFLPLTQSEPVEAPDAVDELNSPWVTPYGVTTWNLTSMEEIETTQGQSVQRIGAGTVSSMFDMLAFTPDGEYLFIPHETPVGAGVSRYSMLDDENHLIFAGDQQGAGADGSRGNSDDQWATDFGAFDPARYTPNGTIIAAEEWSGLGRVVELCNPMDTPADPTASALVEDTCANGGDWHVLETFADVSHEGIQFSREHYNEVIYYIDEDRSGSIYKLVLKNPGDYTGGGQTFVLKAENYLGDVTLNWNEGGNGNPAELQSRFGRSVWEPITDADGNPLTAVNPFDAATETCGAGNADDRCRDEEIRPGRVAADEVGGTPWGRPEDMTLSTSRRGHEMLYVTVTSEQGVISIEERPDGPYVRLFASDAGQSMGNSAFATPTNLDLQATTAKLNSPDNLAIDALGNVYIIEDAPNRSMVGGDIWFARDMDNDGVAESIDQFLSLQVNGAESTGMIFNPVNPTQFVVAVQHPTSTDLSDTDNDGVRDAAGLGDAVWAFDISGVQPPACDGPRRNWMSRTAETRGIVRACGNERFFNVIEKMRDAEPEDDFPTP